MLVIQGKDLATLIEGILALGKEVIIEPATLLKHTPHSSSLAASRIYAIKECLTHMQSIAQKETTSNLGEGFQDLLRTCPLIPMPKGSGLATSDSR